MSEEIPVEGERMLDIGMGWLVRYKGDRIWVDFKVWAVESRSIPENEPKFEDEPSLSGYVKWDGCMNLYTDSQVMRHFCGPEDLREFADVLDALYPLFAEVMPGDPEYFTALPRRDQRTDSAPASPCPVGGCIVVGPHTKHEDGNG